MGNPLFESLAAFRADVLRARGRPRRDSSSAAGTGAHSSTAAAQHIQLGAEHTTSSTTGPLQLRRSSSALPRAATTRPTLAAVFLFAPGTHAPLPPRCARMQRSAGWRAGARVLRLRERRAVPLHRQVRLWHGHVRRSRRQCGGVVLQHAQQREPGAWCSGMGARVSIGEASSVSAPSCRGVQRRADVVSHATTTVRCARAHPSLIHPHLTRSSNFSPSVTTSGTRSTLTR